MSMTLKAARVNRNLTQKQAADQIGVSADVISNWERGISFPDVIQLRKIEKVYLIKYDDIIFSPDDSV